ncbi:MAG: T9SS type A sorting domain-containing protein [Bacteroidetes bacterium]|nr:T9SS type A sorting domain-containing protein [Bacteroidota bacterium]MBP9795753.1 T9SS type A sorting domain-containing protein [Chitinophagales bacterium]
MKNLTLFTILSIFFSSLFSQSPDIAWETNIGGNDWDELRSINQTPDGGYILGGFSISGISGNKTATQIGLYDFYLVKLNASGNIDWQKTYGGNQSDQCYTVIPTSDGGYFAGGWSESDISGNRTEATHGGKDIWITKIDASGNIEWDNAYGGIGEEYLYEIIETSDGGYALGGWSNSGISEDKAEASLGGYDFWVIKINATGSIQWENAIGGTSDERIHGIRQTTDGGYIVGGTSDSDISADKSENNLGEGEDYWVIKLNDVGEIVWENTIGGSAEDELFSIAQTYDGGYILGGFSTSDISADKTESNYGMQDYWVVKIDASGNIEWQNNIGGIYSDRLECITQTHDGGYFVVSGSWSSASGDKIEDAMDWDYWAVKLDNLGNIKWQTVLGGSEVDVTRAILQSQDGGYVMAGQSTSGVSGIKSTPNYGGYDYWVIKLDCAPPEADITASGPLSFCKGESVVLQTISSQGLTYQWYRNDLLISGATNSSFLAKKTGNYKVNVIDGECSSTSEATSVTVYPKPNTTITASGSLDICTTGSVNLQAFEGGYQYKWYMNSTAIPGANSSSYIATIPGNYRVKISNNNSCIKSSEQITVYSTCRLASPDEVISIYPNPASSQIFIQFTNNTDHATIKIINAAGQVVKTIIASENNLNVDVSNFASGIYFIKVESNGSNLFEKFIKE